MTTRRSFMSFLAASVVAVSTSIPMLNRKQVGPVRPWTPGKDLPQYEVIFKAMPKNILGSGFGYASMTTTPRMREQLQLPLSLSEAERRQRIADFYGFAVHRWDDYSRMYGIPERKTA